MNVGDRLLVPRSLTSDPINKQGQIGLVVELDSDVVTLEFSDGKRGMYMRNIWEE